MIDWPHQTRGVEAVVDAIDAGLKSILLVACTGAGKTRMVEQVARRCLDVRVPVSVYTNRKMLIEQLSASMANARIPHGIRAAGHEFEPDALMQISSIATENERTLKTKRWELHKAGVVFVDEAHLNQGGVMSKIRKAHRDQGAAVIDVTATPLDLKEHYDGLIEAGKVSECFECGALLPAIHYAPDEPDMQAWKKANKELAQRTHEGSLTESQVKSIMGNKNALFGRVWGNFDKLNADRRPSILFAPGVQESIWFAEEFSKKGVKAAHIDGKDIWVEGELHRASDTLRAEILNDSKKGRIVVLCNRFVLREGIDCPWLAHGILATIFGSLSTYLQSVGRLLRAFPGMEYKTLQDHGGNWWRYGSANVDREWRIGLTNDMAYQLRAERIRNGKEKEPFLCPQCGRVWVAGVTCNPSRGGCGFVLPIGKKSRPVCTMEGELKFIDKALFPIRKISQRPDGPRLWEGVYYRAKSKKWNATWREAEAFFFREYHAWPDRAWPLMPKDEWDWIRKVSEVSYDRLTQKGTAAA